MVKSYVETIPREGVNTFISELYLGSYLLKGTSVSSYITGGTGINPIEICGNPEDGCNILNNNIGLYNLWF